MKVFVVSGGTIDVDFIVDSVWINEDEAQTRAASLNARSDDANPYGFEYDVEAFNLNGVNCACAHA